MCQVLPGSSLASLDETDIESLLDFVVYLVTKDEEEQNQTVTIGGKTYAKVAAFSTRM